MTRLALVLLLCGGLPAMAQRTYEVQWKRIDSLAGKGGLVQWALKEVDAVYVQAKKEGNDVQLIKALLYKGQLSNFVTDSGAISNIHLLEREMLTAREPALSLLQSLTADAYWQYFQNNRYELYGRLATNAAGTDITTWSAADFHRRIQVLYLASIKKDSLLQATKLASFDPLLVKGNVRNRRPTLFDLLANAALNYFSSPELDLNRPAYAFIIREAAAFAPAEAFVRADFASADSTALQLQALRLYQRLLRFHLKDAQPDALIDADLNRLALVHEYGVMGNRDSLYRQALQAVASAHPGVAAAAQASYLLAQAYANQGARYKPLTTDSSNRYLVNKAMALCTQVVQQFPTSEGGIHAKRLLVELQAVVVGMKTELVNVPGQPFRVLVNYKNTAQLYFRLIAVTPALKTALENIQSDSSWTMLTRQPAIKSWGQALPMVDDHQQHSVEMKADALDVGTYLLLGSVEEHFSTRSNLLTGLLFYVSGISYVQWGNDYFVLNRETGAPLEKAKVQAWHRDYDYKTRKYISKNGAVYTTDQQGHFVLPTTKVSSSVLLDIRYREDRLSLPDFSYISTSTDNGNVVTDAVASAYETRQARLFFFTDRKIYRPGQTLYFKAIGVTKDVVSHQHKLYVPTDSITIFLVNANGMKTDSVRLPMQALGSLRGQFTIPANGVTGEFTLVAGGVDASNNSITVEEYKRPTFSVAFEPVMASYRIADTVIVKGTVVAFAGNKVDGAAVSYRVTRQTRRSYYPWLYGIRGRMQPPQEIVQGTIVTDRDGSFSVRFPALPDESVAAAESPVFTYSISADVTDIQGETHSGQSSVSVGYQALTLGIQLPEGDMVDADSLKTIVLHSYTLNHEVQVLPVELIISRLQPTERLIRARYWQEPDQFLLGRADYARLFPHDEYQHESDFHSWPVAAQVLQDTFTIDGRAFDLSKHPLGAGVYKIEVKGQDRYGVAVKEIQFLRVFNSRTNELPYPAYLFAPVSETTIVPGSKLRYSMGTAAKDVFLLQQRTASRDDSIHKDFIFFTVKRPIQSFEQAISDADKGNFILSQVFVVHNRPYVHALSVNVPWVDKALTVSYSTFRNKLEPGSAERWTAHISGYKGAAATAEVLASMYDASLDQFAFHQWSVPNFYGQDLAFEQWDVRTGFGSADGNVWQASTPELPDFDKQYDYINTLPGLSIIRGRPGYVRSMNALAIAGQAETVPMMNKVSLNDDDRVTDSAIGPRRKAAATTGLPVLRSNFNETAFFFPDLRTDTAGNVSFSFTIPEALTQWKLQTFAHTKELAFGLDSRTTVTQKTLMLQPNVPRFVREGDHLEFGTKVVNMSDKELSGQVQLQLVNAATGEPVDGWFKNVFPVQYFTAGAGQSAAIRFPVDIPYNFNHVLKYRLVAQAGDFSDGEEAPLPVLSNRILLTESQPLQVNGAGTQQFQFKQLLQSGQRESLSHYGLTVEYTSNPVWYAVQALPYLMEYPYSCAEQTFNRYYSYALASSIVRRTPRIKVIFDRWKNDTTQAGALLSNLDKNPELKSVLLEETPWVMQAKDEAQQKRNIALLLDLNRMSDALGSTLDKLVQLQSSNGGFTWFKGGPDDRYMTQYILSGIGHLLYLKSLDADQLGKVRVITDMAIPFLDARLNEDYASDVKKKTKTISSYVIQYLYMRSFFDGYKMPAASQKAYAYYTSLAQQQWLQQNRYLQGMIALALQRGGDGKSASMILASLKETAQHSDESGMFWKDNIRGYYWYQSPIETQALMTEVFSEVGKDMAAVNAIRGWLLKQKQIQNWGTTRATAEACYALLLGGNDWLSSAPAVRVQLGSKVISNQDLPAEAGTGYFKQRIDGRDVTPGMGNIRVSVAAGGDVAGTPGSSGSATVASNAVPPTWGAVYWQYFDDLDQVKGASNSGLKLVKQLYLQRLTDRGPLLELVKDGDSLHIGDKVTVRLEVRSDRRLEYVQLKDMRAACMEPVHVLSSYQWQGGLGYYESTRDAATNFFIGTLPVGTFVFEYPLFVTQAGTYSNGIATVQCMYAPEFSSHSEGMMIKSGE